MILKQNLKNWPLFFRSKIGIFNIFFKRIEGSFEDLEFNSNWKSVPLCHIKWQPLKFFPRLHNSPLLIFTVVKGAVSDLRQFPVIESPWKIMKNTLYFILTNWICYGQITFCTYYAFSLNEMSDIREAWKYRLLKDGFRSISQKN